MVGRTGSTSTPTFSILLDSKQSLNINIFQDTSGGISCPPGIICTSFSSTFDPIGGMSGRFLSYRRGNSGHFSSYRLGNSGHVLSYRGGNSERFFSIEEVFQEAS